MLHQLNADQRSWDQSVACKFKAYREANRVKVEGEESSTKALTWKNSCLCAKMRWLLRDALKGGTDAVNVICRDIAFMAKFHNKSKIHSSWCKWRSQNLVSTLTSTRDKFSKIGSQWRVWLHHCHPAATWWAFLWAVVMEEPRSRSYFHNYSCDSWLHGHLQIALSVAKLTYCFSVVASHALSVRFAVFVFLWVVVAWFLFVCCSHYSVSDSIILALWSHLELFASPFCDKLHACWSASFVLVAIRVSVFCTEAAFISMCVQLFCVCAFQHCFIRIAPWLSV